MEEGYVIRDQKLPHFITVTVVDWIDVFTRKVYRDEVIKCFDYCIKNKGMIIYGYVIMSNHIHMVVQSKDGKLSDMGIKYVNYDLDKSTIVVYPNPAVNDLKVLYPPDIFQNLIIISTNGALINTYSIDSKQTETSLSVKNLTPGSYYIYLSGKEDKVTKQLIIK